MNKEQVQGNFKELYGKMKEKWGDLTDDHLVEIEGKKDKLAGKLQKVYGYSKEEAERQVDDFFRHNK